jgi:hypothetical protein
VKEPAIEERLSVLEKELAQIKEQLATDKRQPLSHPWDHVFGSLADSKGFDEAVRLGREYRESLRPDKNGDGV